MEYITSHFHTKDIKTDKEKLFECGYPEKLVNGFIKKHLNVSAYSGALKEKDNLFLVMPSTSGVNVIPEHLAAHLQKEYGGEILVDFALPMHVTKSAYMGAIAKIKEPREYNIVKESFEGINVSEKNVIIVDDVVTSGTSIESLSKSLLKEGIITDLVISVAQSDKRLVSERDIKRLSEKLATGRENLKEIQKDVEILFTGKLKHALNTVEREITGPKKEKYKGIVYEYIRREASRIRSEASMDRGIQPGKEGQASFYKRGDDRHSEMAVREEQITYRSDSEKNRVGESVADLQRIAREHGYYMNAAVVSGVAEELSCGNLNYDELKNSMMKKIEMLKEKNPSITCEEGLSL
ncbi:MAG: phosphoribosyltransferase [Spirochaetes bacterium]|nr:phosphoribosyltransferase [Spirochaetota bacterium]